MSYEAIAYRVMIASPNDVAPERAIVREVLAEWNSVNSKSTRIVLLPVGWETHLSPEMGARPQAIVNKQILTECDLLVGVFWTRIGTPTGEHESGTVEEIEEHISAGKPAMLYFSDSPVRQDSVDPAQYSRLIAFKQSCKSRGLLESYSDLSDFRTKLYRHVQLKVNNDPFFANRSQPGASDTEVSLAPQSSISSFELTQEAQTLLKEAAKDKNGCIVRVEHLGGTSFRSNDKSLVEGNNPRLIAEWEAALRELESHGLVESMDHKRQVFRITRKGYNSADLLPP